MPVPEVIQRTIPMAEFLSLALGSACEITLLDILSYSVVAGYNVSSGQKVGAIANQNICTAIQRATENREKMIVNQPIDKDHLLSVLFIKDGSSVVGAICLIKKLAAVNQLELSIRNFIEQHALRPQQSASQTSAPEENPVKALLDRMVSAEVNAIGIHPTRFTLDEKAQIVQKLSENGAMMIEGAVAEIARQLYVSEPTVYRYLNRERKR